MTTQDIKKLCFLAAETDKARDAKKKPILIKK